MQAPTIHVFVTGVNTTDNKTFTNFVFEPYVQGTFDLNQDYSLDTMQGKWWSTHPTGDISQGTPASWAHVVATNPNAKIGYISIDNGGSSSGTITGPNFAADADNLVIGFDDTFTRLDFGA